WNAAQGGRVDVAELCRRFGVSRQTGYLWVKRFCDADHDVRALEERSRRPHSSPTAIELEVEGLVVAARKAHPRWGPRKLRAWLRYLLRCEVVLDPDGDAVEHILDSAFQEFGLPRAMRSDNGPLFASTGAAGLTRLSVWWLQLGIRLERIEPGEPQQNGRLER